MTISIEKRVMTTKKRGVTLQQGVSDFFLTLPAGSTIIQIGTSLTDDGYLTASEAASSVGPTARGGDSWTRALTDQQLDWINKGVAGDTIQDMIDRFQTDIVDEDPYAVIVDAGTNDAGSDITTIVNKLEELYQLILTNGYMLIPLTIAMRDNPPWNDITRDKMLAVNNWIKSNYQNAIETNTYFSSGDRPIAENTTDGTHLSFRGGYSWARSYVSNLKIVGTRELSQNVVSLNRYMEGSGGGSDAGISGGVPTNYFWDIIGGHSGTAVTTALDPGMRITFTPGGGGGTEDYEVRYNPLNVTTSAGETYEGRCKVVVNDWDGWTYFQLKMDEPGQGSKYDLYAVSVAGNSFYPEGDLTLTLRTAPIQSVGTFIRPFFEVGISSSAAGTGTMEFSEMGLFKIS